jgi:MFS family permease
MTTPESRGTGSEVPFHLRPNYKWAVVGMLWFMCFFNYADRLAISSVEPLLKGEMGLTDMQWGLVGTAFAFIYGLFAPFAGNVGDLFRRKSVIIWGLYLWSIICIFTASARRFWHLMLWRAAEGLGETFYFPATTSLISDYHGKRTRSRALGLHNTGVYVGTIAGASFAGLISQHYGWRSSFIVFGAFGIVLGLVLAKFIVEPKRGAAELSELGAAQPDQPEAAAAPRAGIFSVLLALVAYVACLAAGTYAGLQVGRLAGITVEVASLPLGAILGSVAGVAAGVALAMRIIHGQRGMEFLRWVLGTPTVLVLMLVFMGANSVALVQLFWLPKFLHDEFGLNLAMSGLTATVFAQSATMVGAPIGGTFADLLRRRTAGGRMIVQALALLLGAPFVYMAGWTKAIPVLLLALTFWGFLKGMYDANIFASAFDVIPPRFRGTAAGFMNMAGWLGGSPGPVIIGWIAAQRGLSTAIASASAVYVAAGLLMIFGVLAFAKRDAARMEAALQANAP